VVDSPTPAAGIARPDGLYDQLQAFIGKPLRAPSTARDAVNQAMVHHWCDAVGDANPVYADADLAGGSVHGGIVAPPTMLQVWNMRGLHTVRPPDENEARLMDLLDKAGYTSVVATDGEQEYVRYLGPGDLLTEKVMVEAISERKRTALGEGYFITGLRTYCQQEDELVGRMRFRFLKFRPVATGALPEARSRRPVPATSGAPEGRVRASPVGASVMTTKLYEDIAVGDELPPLEIEITRTLIVAGAIASRDYQDVHHDPELARQRGSKDIFMNILTTNGLVGRYVTDWAGYESVLQSVRIRLGAPNYPHDTMRFTGRVVSTEVVDGKGAVEVAIIGANSIGDHVAGTVRFVPPMVGKDASVDGFAR
jgi:acyl dehydratase